MTTVRTDSDLLARFVRDGCETSFAELVSLHRPLVVGTALRRTGDTELARDVAQQVFSLLARKAAWLTGRESIAGWLHHAANFLATRAVRSEARTRARHAGLSQDPAALAPDAGRWAALEDALTALDARERESLLLHYFEDRGYPEMAAQLGVSEAAARKRVSRALHSLSAQLRRRGIAVPTTTLLAGATALQTTVPAHAGLATAALSGSSAAPPTMLAITTIMSHTATKIAAAAVLFSAVPFAFTYQENARLRTGITISTPTPVTAFPAPTDPAPTALNREVAVAWEQLRAEQARRMAAEEKVAALTQQLQRVENEVLISLGQVEDLARRTVARFRELEDFSTRMKNADVAEREELSQNFADRFTEFSDIFLAFREAGKLEADPEKAARFHAATLAELAGLDLTQRDAAAKVARERFIAMQQSGLTAPQRPPTNDPSWTAARRRALTEFQAALLHTVPPEKREAGKAFAGFLNFAGDGTFPAESPQ